MVGGAGQRREDEEFEQVDGQLALDDPDITLDRGGGIPWKAQDVSGVGQRAHCMPRLQHRTVFGDAVLTFPRVLERFRVDAFQPDEDTIDTRPAGFFDETRDLMRHRVDLSHDPDG